MRVHARICPISIWYILYRYSLNIVCPMPEKENKSSMELRKVGKTGNSFYITIPNEFAKELNLEKGMYCSIEKKGNTLVITKK